MLAGCSTAGVTRLGSVQLLDGSVIEFIQTKTKGQSGPDVTVVTEYRYDGHISIKTGEYAGQAAGLLEVTAGGLIGALVQGAAQVWAAKIHDSVQVNVERSAPESVEVK